MSHLAPLLNYLHSHEFIDDSLHQTLGSCDNEELVRESLIESGIFSARELNKLEALFSGIPYREFTRESVDPAVQSLIPYELSREQRIVCVGESEAGIDVITDQSYIDGELMSELSLQVSSLTRSDSQSIDRLLGHYREHAESAVVNSIMTTAGKVRTEKSYGSRSMLEFFPSDYKREIAEDVSSLKLLRKIVSLAQLKHAEKITIRPDHDDISIISTIRGKEYPLLKLPKAIEGAIYLKLRYLADMPLSDVSSIEEAVVSGLSEVDSSVTYHVTFVPHALGITCIIQNATTSKEELLLQQAELGYQDSAKLKQIIAAGQGLIAVSGLSGSGKTFACYHLLEALAVSHKTVSLEDQVEYIAEGVDQMTYSSQANRDLQNVTKHYQAVGLLPLRTSSIQAAYNAAQQATVVALCEEGVIALVKNMIGLGLRAKDIARTMPYNLISYYFTALGEGEKQEVRLKAEDIASIEEYLPLVHFNNLLANEGYSQTHASWKEIVWAERVAQRRGWFGAKALYHRLPLGEEKRVYIRALIPLGEIVHDSYRSGGSLRDMQYNITIAQKEALLSRALLAAYRHEVALSDALAMLRS